MSEKINQNLDQSDTFQSDIDAAIARWASEIFTFRAGESSLQDRLAAIQRLIGGQTRMSETIGVSVSAIKSWLRGTEPGLLKIVQLAEATSLSIGYISTGKAEIDRDFDCELERLDEHLKHIPIHHSIPERREAIRDLGERARLDIVTARDAISAGRRVPPAGLVEIPRFEVRAAAGAGAVVLAENVSSYFAVEKEWLRRTLPAWAGQNAVVGILEGSGDSMEPTIRDGDLIMAVKDPPEHIIDRGGVFLVLHHGHLRIKRLHMNMRSGDITLISDNTRYPPEVVPRDRQEFDLTVLAQIFFAGGRLRT